MAILLEETKGVLPVWLAPVQVEILPVSPEKHGPYAAELAAALRAKGIRTEVDERNEKLGYRVREAQTKKIPVELVVGDQEAESHGVTLRRYGSKDEVKMSFAEFAEMIEKEIAAKSVKA